MKKIIRTKSFKKDFRKLPQPVQKIFKKKLGFLLKDLSHPSLRIKIVRKYEKERIFEGTIDKNHRFLFQITEEGYILLRVGRHDILEKI
jgi:mRNA-degrading endonuclease RelE of RelBE toxin-antitoxin system